MNLTSLAVCGRKDLQAETWEAKVVCILEKTCLNIKPSITLADIETCNAGRFPFSTSIPHIYVNEESTSPKHGVFFHYVHKYPKQRYPALSALTL